MPPALIFDLDGTLVDTVYAHVLAWERALADYNLAVPAWRIHLRVGMSGALVTEALSREVGRRLSAAECEGLPERHNAHYREIVPRPVPLPGAVALLRHLHDREVRFGIATSGQRLVAQPSLDALQLPSHVPVVNGDEVSHAKPAPDILLAVQHRLGVAPDECIVVGDAVWDHLAARRARMTSVGVLTGGTSATELFHAGAMRVFQDPAELTTALAELGLEEDS